MRGKGRTGRRGGERGREQTARTFGTGTGGWRRAKREAVWAQTRDGEGAVLSRRATRVTQDAPATRCLVRAATCNFSVRGYVCNLR